MLLPCPALPTGTSNNVLKNISKYFCNLEYLRDVIEQKTGFKYNFVLVNR